MAGLDFISTGPAGALLAVACVIAGGPWFADGLRALRARRVLRALGDATDRVREGRPGLVRGRVALTSPLFGPLSGRPCAGWTLDVRDERGAFVGRVHDEREFLLELDEGTLVVETGATWNLAIGDERTYGSAAELGTNVSMLFERAPELRWAKARGGALTVCERALFAGAEAHVLGCAERDQLAHAEPVVLRRTGTDDAPVEAHAAEGSPTWRVGPCETLEHVVVSDRAPEPAQLAPPLWRAAGAVLGPALVLAGLLVLAQATGRTISGAS